MNGQLKAEKENDKPKMAKRKRERVGKREGGRVRERIERGDSVCHAKVRKSES